MSVDYRRTKSVAPPTESETPMFAGTPVWERGRKARGARRSTFQNTDTARRDTTPVTTAVTDDAARETVTTPNGDEAPFVAPAPRMMTVRRKRSHERRERSVAPTAIGVGLIALAALAAAGYYATRPADTTLTPGGALATSIATAPAMTSATATTSLAATTPPDSAAAEAAQTSAAPPPTTTTTTTRSATTTSRTTRPAARTHSSSATAATASPEQAVTSPSATSAGVNTGTTTPLGAASSTSSAAPAPPAAGPAPVTPSAPAAPPAATMPPPAATPSPGTTAPDTSTPSSTTPQ